MQAHGVAPASCRTRARASKPPLYEVGRPARWNSADKSRCETIASETANKARYASPVAIARSFGLAPVMAKTLVSHSSGAIKKSTTPPVVPTTQRTVLPERIAK